jgi:hypothetical protein
VYRLLLSKAWPQFYSEEVEAGAVWRSGKERAKREGKEMQTVATTRLQAGKLLDCSALMIGKQAAPSGKQRCKKKRGKKKSGRDFAEHMKTALNMKRRKF